MADSGRGQSDDRRSRRPDILDGHDDGHAGWATQTSLGLQRLRRSQPMTAPRADTCRRGDRAAAQHRST
jgi:hypothetical protein